MESRYKVILTLFVILACRTYLLLSLQKLVLLGFVFALLIWYFDDKNFRNFPPNPPQVPLIGTLGLILTKHQYEYADYVHRKYGPIVHAPIGKTHLFLIGDFQIAKELSFHPEFQLRPPFMGLAEFYKKLGLAFSEGDLWKHQRRFVLHSLRDSGMGKLRIQEKIHEELVKVMSILEQSNGSPLYVHSLLEKSTANIIFALAFNKQFDYDDQDFIERIDALDDNFRLLSRISALSVIKFLKPLLNGIRGKMFANIELMKLQSQEFIDEHRETLDPNNPRDLLDLYLIEMERVVEEEEEQFHYHKTFFEEQLKYLILDLFAGGAETSSTTIRWALLHMIRHPDVQDKVRNEIDSVVGRERFPRVEDKQNLPYTVAALQESERLGSVIPQALPRSNGRAVNFHGYTIPSKSIVLFSLFTIHRDPNLWTDPDTFNPDRFIGDDGKVFRPPHLVPFGSGRRGCPGESLARMEIFLYFATLIQNYVFEAPDKLNPPPATSPKGAIRAPSLYEIRCNKRRL